jgi:hypothetical protein
MTNPATIDVRQKSRKHECRALRARLSVTVSVNSEAAKANHREEP